MASRQQGVKRLKRVSDSSAAGRAWKCGHYVNEEKKGVPDGSWQGPGRETDGACLEKGGGGVMSIAIRFKKGRGEVRDRK